MRTSVLAIVTAIAGFGAGRLLLSTPPTGDKGASAPPPTPIISRVQAEIPVSTEPPSAPAKLEDALGDKDVLRRARSAEAWLKAASLEDLRALAGEPKKLVGEYSTGLAQDVGDAFLDAFMDRWLTLSPGDITRIGGKGDAFLRLRLAAARTKPELVIAQLSSDGTKSPFDDVEQLAVLTIAERDLDAAREILKTRKVRGAESIIICALAKRDVIAAVALLPKLTGQPSKYPAVFIIEAAERIGPGAVRQVFAAAGDKLDAYPDLPRLLMRYPDLADDLRLRKADGEAAAAKIDFDQKLIRDADLMSPDARAKLIAAYDELPAANRDQLFGALACAWAHDDPHAAAEWAVAHAKPQDETSTANVAAKFVFIRWVNADPQAAFQWWQTLPASPLRDVIGLEASTRFAENDDFDTALKLFRPIPGLLHGDDIEHFSQFYATRDPAATAAWLATLPADVPSERTVEMVTNRFYNRDPAGTSKWLDSLQSGAVRDIAVGRFIVKAASSDPASTAEWVGRIGDMNLRTEAAKTVVSAWERESPANAREWVEKQQGLDDRWRSSYLRK